MRRKNPNAFKEIERQQILIPCYEVGGAAANGQREKLVIFGISASVYL
jgi:hypothetical protein